MLHELSQIPHPSLTEVVIASETFLILYPLRIVVRRIEREERLLRKVLIKRHVKHHKGRYVNCRCATHPKTHLGKQSHLDQVIASEPQYSLEP